jgi:capsular polysaccharide export protein
MRDLGNAFGRRRGQGVPAAAGAVLFPEFAGRRAAQFAGGLLRAPPRGRLPAPCLSGFLRHGGRDRLPGEPGPPEQVLSQRGWESEALSIRAAAARREIVAARVGGDWWHAAPDAKLPPDRGHVLVLLGEPGMPGRGGQTRDRTLIAMLDAALADNAAERTVVLAPQRISQPMRSRIAAACERGAILVGGRCDPWPLLDGCTRVYGSGGEIGFFALLADIPVKTFAPSVYTGWGSTEDADGVPQQPFRRTSDEIFAGLCLIAMRCRDPFRDRLTSFEETVSLLADWRRVDETNRSIAVCVGMSFWKRRRIADFLRSSAGVPVFRRSAAGALAAASAKPGRPPGAIAGWASRLPEGLVEAAADAGVRLVRVEDGFIRSVGLGSDFLPPASLVLDGHGMYFDPRRQSDLEHLLLEAKFSPALLSRAGALAAQLVAMRVTKYNLADRGPQISVPPGRRCILVPGQVEDDLSIRFGAGAVRTNLDLLTQVRAANPDAFILYKPHPDVLAGHRIGAVPDDAARRFADLIVLQGSAAAMLEVADEVHTMTSLAGFEALLRGRRVVVYGRPFYAGWGLTTERHPFDRGRRLTLEQLVAGTLILYPRYLDPLTRLPCGPEVVIERLERPELWRPGPLVRARRLQGAIVRRIGEFRATLPALPAAGARRLRERPGR